MYTSWTINSTTGTTLGLLSVKFTARWYVVRQLSFVIPRKGWHGNGARPLRHFGILAMSNFWWLMSTHIIIYKMILNQRRLWLKQKLLLLYEQNLLINAALLCLLEKLQVITFFLSAKLISTLIPVGCYFYTLRIFWTRKTITLVSDVQVARI